MTITIPAHKESALRAFIDKINRKAAKHGVAEVTLIKGESGTRSMIIVDKIDGDETERKVEVRTVDFEVVGDLFTLKGWSFVATVEVLETGKSVFHKSIFSSDLVIPETYSTSGHTCEHCGHNRQRKNTYLVHHETEGFKQVGSTCLKDFLGGHSVAAFAFCSTVVNLIDSCADDFWREYGNMNLADLVNVKNVLTVAANVIRLNGFVSKSKAFHEYCTPTATYVSAILDGTMKGQVDICESDRQKALDTLKWLQNLSQDEIEGSDYLDKLYWLSECKNVERQRNLGILVSAIAAYDRMMENKARLEAAKLSDWQGAIGDKLELELTVVGNRTVENHYSGGEKSILTFKDITGNVFTWFASKVIDCEIGNALKIKGTVKDHSTFRDCKQTVLTRCKVL